MPTGTYDYVVHASGRCGESSQVLTGTVTHLPLTSCSGDRPHMIWLNEDLAENEEEPEAPPEVVSACVPSHSGAR